MQTGRYLLWNAGTFRAFYTNNRGIAKNYWMETRMRSIGNHVTHLTLLAMLALSMTGCATGGGQATTPVAPAPTSTTISMPTTEPNQGPTTGPTRPADRPEPKPTGRIGEGQTPGGEAMIDDIEVLIRESFPVQVSVSVRGNLSDACTKIGEITTTRDGNTFNISISTTRPANAMCAQVLTPFEQSISLDVKGLKKGTYTVNVNGVAETFELAIDNE